jgi:hypothetical protein
LNFNLNDINGIVVTEAEEFLFDPDLPTSAQAAVIPKMGPITEVALLMLRNRLYLFLVATHLGSLVILGFPTT